MQALGPFANTMRPQGAGANSQIAHKIALTVEMEWKSKTNAHEHEQNISERNGRSNFLEKETASFLLLGHGTARNPPRRVAFFNYDAVQELIVPVPP